jgi:hypothetical protein
MEFHIFSFQALKNFNPYHEDLEHPIIINILPGSSKSFFSPDRIS